MRDFQSTPDPVMTQQSYRKMTTSVGSVGDVWNRDFEQKIAWNKKLHFEPTTEHLMQVYLVPVENILKVVEILDSMEVLSMCCL
jgi:hypothetical protein